MQVNLQLPENDDKKYRTHTHTHTVYNRAGLLAPERLTRVISHRPEVKST